MEHEHSAQAIARRLSRAPAVSYLRDWVYGGIDGAVTTFAIVAGMVGAELSNRVVLILGIANLVADGFSMAASNYSGTKTEHEEQAQLRAIEERHIDVVPDGEREEIVIAEGGAPVARLLPLEPRREPRKPGLLKGQIWIAEDFDDPLLEEIMAAFRGERP